MKTSTPTSSLPNSLPTASHWSWIGTGHHHGIVAPLSSIHSHESCGIGEFLDLIPLIDWCHDSGLSILQLLPLNDSGGDPSPYNALSSCALNPIYLSLSALQGIRDLTPLQQKTQEERVPYHTLYNEKRRLLDQWLDTHQETIASTLDFQKYHSQNPWIAGYGLFKVLKNQFHGSDWREWPQALREAQHTALDEVIDTNDHAIEREMVIQYLCHQQMTQVRAHADSKKVHLMGDLPILLSPDSADVWLAPDYFDCSLGAGAPPDNYSKEGQNWGFPLYDWDAIAADDYEWWKQRLRVAEQYYHIYRLDHVVGFYRIWAVPHGETGLHGHFIPADCKEWIPQGEQILRTLLKTSQMLPVGEDLGDIPPEVRTSMKALGIPGMRVMRWERDWEKDGSAIPIDNYPTLSLCTVSTHDSETLSDWWESQPEEAEQTCKDNGWKYTTPLSSSHLDGLLFQSHHSGSLLHCNLLQEYLALYPELVHEKPSQERINTPNTVSINNWTYRYLPSIEEIAKHKKLTHTIRSLIG